MTLFPVRDFGLFFGREVGIPVAGAPEFVAQSTNKVGLGRRRHELGGCNAQSRAGRCAYSAAIGRSSEELRKHHPPKTLPGEKPIEASIHHGVRQTAANENCSGNLPAVDQRRPAMAQ